MLIFELLSFPQRSLSEAASARAKGAAQGEAVLEQMQEDRWEGCQASATWQP